MQALSESIKSGRTANVIEGNQDSKQNSEQNEGLKYAKLNLSGKKGKQESTAEIQ